MSELKEQCSLEQQAKAHLEEELRSDLEEKDHKIAALLTKVQILESRNRNNYTQFSGLVDNLHPCLFLYVYQSITYLFIYLFCSFIIVTLSCDLFDLKICIVFIQQ